MKKNTIIENLITMSTEDFAKELYYNHAQGVEEGLYIQYKGYEIIVQITDEDVASYAGIENDPEAVLDYYQSNEEEIDLHFIQAQKDEILEQIQDQEED